MKSSHYKDSEGRLGVRGLEVYHRSTQKVEVEVVTLLMAEATLEDSKDEAEEEVEEGEEALTYQLDTL